jgi:ABC-type phosphate transport system substrate-binding protein
MDISVLQKRIALGPLAVLAVGLALVSGLVFVSTSSAAVPGGVACQPTDGKISGRGATYQNEAELDFIAAYTSDYCGNVAEQFAGDPAGSNMLVYNYPAAEAGNTYTGSSQGLIAASCRTDAYAGTSLPYTQAQLLELNSTPGILPTNEGKTCTLPITVPFTPQSPYPNSNDIAAPIMTIPVAGSAVALAVNLTGSCTNGTPTSLEFTPLEVSRLYGGDYLTWNEPELVATNPELGPSEDNCTGAITRVVRTDSSGPAVILKNYLESVDEARTGSACGVVSSVIQVWSKYYKKNTEWPGLQHPGTEGTCSSIVKSAANGNASEIAKVLATNGGIGFADLAAATGQGLILADVENATGSNFVGPSAGGGAANCNFNVVSLPGTTNESAVGLTTSDDWAYNNHEANPTKVNHSNATDLGTKYPICGLGFDLVYTGLHANNGSGQGAIAPLTSDQRRTLYSYFNFVLSSTAQELLPLDNYASLPSTWLTKLSKGFREHF